MPLPDRIRIIDIHHSCITEDGKSVVIEFITSDGGSAGISLLLDELEHRCSPLDDDSGEQALLEQVSALIRRAARR